jgi:hypothetical protein
MSVILATQEAEIRRIMVQSQPRQIVSETLSQKKTHHKNRADGVVQGKGPKFKCQYHKKKKIPHAAFSSQNLHPSFTPRHH